ncbi:MAG: RNA methyltransferase [Ignavibacteria bacterium]|nr:RNA methyltransferase [Ignavibacteria bacterium]
MITARELKVLISLKKKKYRQFYRKFLVEGIHLSEECLKSSHKPERIILREGFKLSSYPTLFKLIKKTKVNVSILSADKFNKISDTENSQGIICVLPFLESKPEVTGDLVLGLDRISDPGNLGTIFRSAYWFGVKDVLISEGSADIYNSKVIRASQGAVFYLNLIANAELKSVLSELFASGYQVFIFEVSSPDYIHEIIKPEKSVIVFGNEANGINQDIVSPNFQTLKIRGFSDCESLNVAMSVSIGLYEFRRVSGK